MPTQIAVMHHNQHATRLDNTTHASYTAQCHWTGVMLGKSNGNNIRSKMQKNTTQVSENAKQRMPGAFFRCENNTSGSTAATSFPVIITNISV